MQAIIMAAGKGSRISRLTNENPKSFLEVRGKKLIEYNIAVLKKLGVKEIVVVTGYREEAFRELLGDRKDIRYIYNPFYEFVNVIGSFYMGQEALKEDFFYLHADTLADVTIFEDLIKAKGDIVLPYDPKPCDSEAMKLRSENHRVVEINKTMRNESADGEFIGIAKISKSVLSQLKEKTIDVLKEKRYGEYFEAALQKIMDEGKYDVTAMSIGDRFWAEIDFEEDYNRAKKEISDSLLEIAYTS